MSDYDNSLRGKDPIVSAGYGRWVIGATSLLLVIISFLPVGSSEDGAVRFRWDLPDHITPLSIGELRASPTDWALGMFVYAPALAGVCGLASVVVKPAHRGDWAGFDVTGIFKCVDGLSILRYTGFLINVHFCTFTSFCYIGLFNAI